MGAGAASYRVSLTTGPVGGRGILLEPGFQGVDALLEMPQGIAYGTQRGLHGRRGLFPVLWGKGKRPAGGGGRRQRFHDVSRQQTIGSDR